MQDSGINAPTKIQSPRRLLIEVEGIVQGVGFRPFVHRLASTCSLVGFVTNTSDGVEMEVEGPAAGLDHFLHTLRTEPPPLAVITEIRTHDRPAQGETEFSIRGSIARADHFTLISPDVCICEDCLRELYDPADRRFGYPFSNCTNCGPRYTIIQDIPYDRDKTTMAVFPMCPDCEGEYHDPANRRFHAQPNACWVCGPRVDLLDRSAMRVESADSIETAAEWLVAGKILAVKGLGGFHLACDAANDAAVQELRRRKRREEKPFALMAYSLGDVETFCEVSEAEADLLRSRQRPIVLLKSRLANSISRAVAPGQKNLGVMLPYTPLHYLLLMSKDRSFDPPRQPRFLSLVMTSGNLSEEPIAIDNAEALDRLGDLADGFLMHNRDICLRSDDSVARIQESFEFRVASCEFKGKADNNPKPGTRNPERVFLRRSRGYVPVPVFLKDAVPPVLACGGHLKNTICLTRDRSAFLSQHIGDLENPEAVRFFEETAEHLKRILRIKPLALACDLHPDYWSTRYARAQGHLPVIAIQHHHAHIASVMAEHHLEEPVIGVAFDGTGYGTDGTVWGGEIFLGDLNGFERVGCLRPVPLPGGERAVREPWRMAMSYLHAVWGEDLWNLALPCVKGVDPPGRILLNQMLAQGIRSPLTSSMGRLFDAVAALMGLPACLAGRRGQVTYEGQAAMELEACLPSYPSDAAYPVEWVTEDGILVADVRPLISRIVQDVLSGLSRQQISLQFHNAVVRIVEHACQRVREQSGVKKVALSGGCFQNQYLSDQAHARLVVQGFEVYQNAQVPVNDGGIALGQAVLAARQVNS